MKINENPIQFPSTSNQEKLEAHRQSTCGVPLRRHRRRRGSRGRRGSRPSTSRILAGGPKGQPEQARVSRIRRARQCKPIGARRGWDTPDTVEDAKQTWMYRGPIGPLVQGLPQRVALAYAMCKARQAHATTKRGRERSDSHHSRNRCAS